MAAKSTSAAAVVYRALLKQCKKLQQHGQMVEIRKPLTGPWGSHQFSDTGPVYRATVAAALALPVLPDSERLGGQELRQIVREAFRQPKEARGSIDQAFNSLRTLLEQLYLERCSSSCTTEGVQVDATSQFAHTAQMGGRQQFIFTYRIRVTNLREDPVQVLGREWTIKNDRGETKVHVPLQSGNAVVGLQPIIPPQKSFEYYSGTDLDTPSGLQDGKLEVALLDEAQKQKPSRVILATVKPFVHMQPGLQRV